ncbi:MAG TPA: pirin family protein [Noviherbaspirillum sp.]|nr:pirin family protein [Noviherbaspirillum sp.]
MKLDWLDARFSFSFGGYRDPQRNGFGPLVALNEDVIQPGTGFEMHPHKDLEIFIIPLSGVVEHRDSLGNHAFVRPGDVQKMTAGSGIWHSQMNASTTKVDHHLQVWLRPRTPGAEPAVDQRRFDIGQRIGRWQALVTPDGRDGSLSVDQDASIHAAILLSGHVLELPALQSGSVYLHVVKGSISAGIALKAPLVLDAGDALAMTVAAPVQISATSPQAEVLAFALPAV